MKGKKNGVYTIHPIFSIPMGQVSLSWWYRDILCFRTVPVSQHEHDITFSFSSLSCVYHFNWKSFRIFAKKSHFYITYAHTWISINIARFLKSNLIENPSIDNLQAKRRQENENIQNLSVTEYIFYKILKNKISKITSAYKSNGIYRHEKSCFGRLTLISTN